MDQIIKATIDAYMNNFDSYEVTDESMMLEIQKLHADFNELGESCANAEQFMARFASEGYMDKYTALVAKLYMPDGYYNEGNDSTTDSLTDNNAFSQNEPTQNESTQQIMSVKDYVEQYRISYEEVKADGNRKRAERAYEAIFDVANRTSDMQDAQLIFERERLLFNIVKEDFIDIAENTLGKVDPNYLPIYLPLKKQMDSYLDVNSDEELTYSSELAVIEKEYIKIRETARMTAMLALSYLILKWMKSKRAIRKWAGGPAVKAAAVEMVRIREKTKSFYKFMCDSMGLSFDVIECSPFLRLCLLNPTALDEFSMKKKVQHPDNVDAIRQILLSEIVSDKSIGDILTEQQSYTYYFSNSNKRGA